MEVPAVRTAPTSCTELKTERSTRRCQNELCISEILVKQIGTVDIEGSLPCCACGAPMQRLHVIFSLLIKRNGASLIQQRPDRTISNHGSKAKADEAWFARPVVA